MKKKITLLIFIFPFAIAVFSYWTFCNPHYSTIPIIFNPAKIPLIKASIQGEEHFLEMDLGSKFQISLDKDVLEVLKKEPEGTVTGKDLNGNSYTSNAFLLKKIRLGNQKFQNIIAKEVDKNFISNTTLFINSNRKKNEKTRISGSIGRPLFTKTNLLLDFPNSKVHFCDKVESLKKNGIPVEDWSQAAFEIGRTGIIIKVETDIGKVRLSLDTGTTLTMLREPSNPINHSLYEGYGLPYFISSKFIIGDKDFGNMNVYLYKITPEVEETDGILGMDFLQSHPVYLDYQTQKIYIGNSIP